MASRAELDAAAAATVMDLAARGLRRAPRGVADGEIDLVTNDYLSLRRDPRVIAAAAAALQREGAGPGGARLLGGDQPSHHALEEELASWQGEQAAVAFATGTAAAQGVLGALLGSGDLAVSDAWNHGSLVDGIRLSGCRKAITPHGDADAVDRALARDPGHGTRLVVVEGVHGMEGDRAPLRDLAEICRRRDALLLVDEAHAIGLLGPDGAGAVAEAGCADVVAARVNPCGKALAATGGVVTCSAAVAELLVHRARAYLFATALAPALAAAAREAARIARREHDRRGRVLARAEHLRQALALLGADVRGGGGGSAIVPWIFGAPAASVEAARVLRDNGFAVHPVRPPTVPEGTSRLRLSLHADLPMEALERLIAVAGARVVWR